MDLFDTVHACTPIDYISIFYNTWIYLIQFMLVHLLITLVFFYNTWIYLIQFMLVHLLITLVFFL